MDCLRHLARVTQSMKWNLMVDDVFGAWRQDRSINLSGGNGIDAYALRSKLMSHLSRQGEKCCLGHRISSAREGMDFETGNRGDIGNCAPGACQLGKESPGEQGIRDQIDVENGRPRASVALEHAKSRSVFAFGRDPRIVHERVQFAVRKPTTYFFGNLLDGIQIREVRLNMRLSRGWPLAVFGKRLSRHSENLPVVFLEQLYSCVSDPTTRAGK